MPTRARYHVIGATTLAAVMLYLDRVCLGEIAKLAEFKSSMNLEEWQTDAVLSAFFFSYALCQVPAGWMSDRFGARATMPLYILVWSAATVLTGLATGFAALIAARLLFGVAQAGCYPTAGGVVRRWMPLRQRGAASGIVSFGGRVGGALAPVLTAWLLANVLPWRMVLTVYGTVGFFAAMYFWWAYRDSPAVHPRVNSEESEWITRDSVDTATAGSPAFPPLWPLIRSGSMWCMCLLQFGINVGWVFLITKMPTYLQDVKGVDQETGGVMSTIVLSAGIVGMLCGGPLTDIAARRLGRRWGRSLQVVVCSLAAAATWMVAPWLENAWLFIAAAALVAFMTDLGVPAIWAYMQDVGGENTAAVFGWGNMWGNLGAFFMSRQISTLLEKWDSNHDWHEAFWIFAAGYVVAGLAALFINADRKIQ